MLDRLARGLVTAGHDVLLAAPAGSSCSVPRVSGLRPPDTARMGHSVVEIPHVLAAYEAMSEVDVVHDHTVVGPFCGQPQAGVPVVTTNHGPFDADLTPIYAALSHRVAVVAISRHQASTARGVRIARVIHHGIDVDEVPVGSGSGGYACFLGRMAPGKGVREAVLAARQAGMPLRIAAKMHEPLELEYFEQAVRPLLGGDVEYLGEVAAEDKYELLGGAVALLNPLQWPEPFGLVMIEALACGTPVVANACGAVPEIVSDGVSGFIRDGWPRLAEALSRVAELDRSSCRAAALSSFSTSLMVARHVELYEELLNPDCSGSTAQLVRRHPEFVNEWAKVDGDADESQPIRPTQLPAVTSDVLVEATEAIPGGKNRRPSTRSETPSRSR